MILILFYLFSFLLILSSFMVVSSKNPIHSVLYLVLSFFNVAALLILIKIEFISIIFIIVYVGAIAVLFLFCVMMFNIKLIEVSETMLRYLPLSGFIGIIFFCELSFVLLNTFNQGLIYQNFFIDFNFINWFSVINNNLINIIAIGQVIYTYYVLLFIICSMILLIAMMGSIILTLSYKSGLRRQIIFNQLSRDFSKTVFFKL